MLFLSAALFVVSLGFGILAPTFPEVASRSGLSGEASLSLAYSCYSAAKIASQVPAGTIVDRVGGGKILKWALGLYSAAMLALAVAVPLPVFLFARVGEGVAEGAIYPAILSIIRKRTTPAKIGQKIGYVVGLGSSGLLIGPVLGAVLAKHGFKPLTLVTAIAGAVLLAMSLVLHRRGSDEPAVPVANEEKIGVVELLFDRSRLSLAIPVGFNKLMTSGFFALFPLYVAAKFGANEYVTAAFFLVAGVAFVSAQAIGGWLADKHSLRTLFFVYVPALLLSTAALSVCGNAYAFGAVLFAQTFTQSCIMIVCIRALAGEKGSANQFGGVIGAMATATDLMTVPGPPLALLLFHLFQAKAFAVLAVLGVPFYVVRYVLNRGIAAKNTNH